MLEQLNQKFPNQRKVTNLLLIFVAVAGIYTFFFITNTFEFRDTLFELLYPKPETQAAGIGDAFGVTNAAGSPLPQPTENTFNTDSLDVQIKLEDADLLNQ